MTGAAMPGRWGTKTKVESSPTPYSDSDGDALAEGR